MALTGQKLEEKQFENEVNRIARQLYPNTEGDGSIMWNGRERDGVFVNEDNAIAIESTVSKGRGKAFDDGRKLLELCNYLAEIYPDHDIRGYFITKHEPTADQRTAIQSFKSPIISALSFDAFRNRLVKVGDYLDSRTEASFGSARNPIDGSLTDLGEYLPIDFVQLNNENQLWNFKRLLHAIRANERIVLLGDYGAGKSMTLRQVFLALKTEYSAGATTSFPLHLNLRQHHGQDEPAEALERHGRIIGFRSPTHLVRAWRAGYAHVILDGFDEIAPPNLGGGASDNEQVARRSSVELVRKFIRETPISASVLIAGRRHFFYGATDLLRAMDLSDDTTILSASDFTDAQVADYLEERGWTRTVPAWLPNKPLLLGYLAALSVLADLISTEGLDATEGRDFLLSHVFDREARIENGLSGVQLRHIFERIATRARRSGNGLGPIYFEDARQSFRDVVGHAPDTKHEVALRRLPMLYPDDAEKESRSIIDSTLADVARSGDVVRYIQDPYSYDLDSSDWLQLLESAGITHATRCLDSKEGRTLTTAALVATVRGKNSAPALAADILSIAIALECTIGEPFAIRNLAIEKLELHSQMDLSRIEFIECIFGRLEICANPPSLPLFYDCVFVQIEGVSSRSELSSDNFINCDFEQFLSSTDQTSASLLSLDVSAPIRVALVILKKLYVQDGSGRQDNALRRGMSPELYPYVNRVIDILLSEGLMAKSPRRGPTTIWVPIRSQMARAYRIFDSATSPQVWGESELISKLESIRV